MKSYTMHYNTLLLGLLLLGFASCSLIDQLDDIEFTFGGPEVPFTITEQDRAGTYRITARDVEINLQDELDDNGVNGDRLRSITPNSATLRILTGNAPVDFGAVDRASVRIEAGGRSPIVFSETDLSALSGNQVTLDVGDVDVLEYLRNNRVDFILEIETNVPIPSPVEVGLRTNYRVEADAT